MKNSKISVKLIVCAVIFTLAPIALIVGLGTEFIMSIDFVRIVVIGLGVIGALLDFMIITVLITEAFTKKYGD